MRLLYERVKTDNLSRMRVEEGNEVGSQHVQFNLEEFPLDSGKRPKISTYHPNHEDIVYEEIFTKRTMSTYET
jgi:hypothetical protein